MLRATLAILALACVLELAPAGQEARLTMTTSPGGKQIVRLEPNLGLPFSPAVKAGGLIYVSGAIATEGRDVYAPGDVKAQTRRVLDDIARVLDAAGSSLASAASMTVYLKRAEDFAAMNEVYRGYWTSDPPTRTTLVADLVLPGAMVEIAAIAIPAGGERQVVHPSGWMKSPNPYSYGIKSGDTLFLAGLVARNGKDNSIIEGDIATQTRTVLDNGGEILKAAGMSHQDVVSARIYITETRDFEAMNTAYRTYFPAAPPARATVRAALTNPQYLVEITMLAVKDASRQAVTTPAADGSAGRVNPNLSSAIKVGGRLHLSGMLGNTESNKGDVAAQTRETLARIARTLAAAGFTPADVVDGVVYLTEVTKFAAMNEAYRAMFTKDFPARATVRVGLVAPDGLVEIMMVAVK